MITRSCSGPRGIIAVIMNCIFRQRRLLRITTVSHPYFLSLLILEEIVANRLDYSGCPTVATRNPFEISLANFTVLAGANRIERSGASVANGSVESGALQRGDTKVTNLTLNTQTGSWNVTMFDQMFIKYGSS
jgi:hypothetical protein